MAGAAVGRRPFALPVTLRTERGTEEGRKVTWLELFFDLVFVAAVAQVGTHLRDDYSLAGLLRFALLFVLIWWAWLGHTTFSTRFDTDDVVQRALTGLQLFLVAVMAVNATGALDGRDSAGFAAAYAVMRLASALVPAPARFWLWAVALTLDIGTPLLSTRHLVDVPHDAAHLPERYGLFSIILIGESMAAVMAGMGHQEYWSVRAASAAILGMAMVFATWWVYFAGVAATAHRVVRSMSDAVRFHVWTYAHLSLYLGIAVAGVGLERVIETATEAPLPRSEALILSSAGAIVVLALTAIGLSRQPLRRPARAN